MPLVTYAVLGIAGFALACLLFGLACYGLVVGIRRMRRLQPADRATMAFRQGGIEAALSDGT